MDKIDLPERPDWREEAAKLGFNFADMEGEFRTQQMQAVREGAHRTTRRLHRSDGEVRHAQLTFAPIPGEVGQDVVGLVQVEAMLQGVPVVASDLAGMREPVRQTGMGFLARPGDPDHLRDCIAKVLTEGPPQRADLARLRQLFGPETSCAPYFELAEEIVRQS